MTGYEYLTRQFQTDLIDEIKEMVLITIKCNESNIKSSFLLDFI
jgi:hypothetical protein